MAQSFFEVIYMRWLIFLNQKVVYVTLHFLLKPSISLVTAVSSSQTKSLKTNQIRSQIRAQEIRALTQVCCSSSVLLQ